MEHITLEEWYAELERVTSQSRTDDAGMTIEEIREALKMNTRRARDFVRAGTKAGRIAVGKRYVACDWDGRGRTYVVFHVVKS